MFEPPLFLPQEFESASSAAERLVNTIIANVNKKINSGELTTQQVNNVNALLEEDQVIIPQ